MSMPALNTAALQKLAAEIASSRRDAPTDGERENNYIKLENGRNKFFFLLDPNGVPFSRYFQHFVKLPGAGRKPTPVICPELSKLGSPCPICYATRRLRDDRPDLYEQLKGYRPSTRTAVNLIPVEIGDKPFAGELRSYILSGPGELSDKLEKFLTDPELEGWYFYSGANHLIIDRKQGPKGEMDVKYDYSVSRSRYSFPGDVEALTSKVVDFTKLIKFTKEQWEKSVAVANQIIEAQGGKALPVDAYPGYGSTSSLPPAQVTEPPATATPPTEVKEVASQVSTEPVVRDHKKRDANGIPFCRGNHSPTDSECGDCAFEDSCLVDTRRRAKKATEA